MSAANLDITIEQGSTFSRTLIIKDSDGDPIDLTGESFAGQVRSVATSSEIAGSFILTLLNQITNPGEVLWEMTADAASDIPVSVQTKAAIKPTFYAYDIERTLANGDKERIIFGVVSVMPEVTR